MGTLLLRLAAPLQSWGVDSKFDTRRTEREPSKSGVLGMIAAALGRGREDSLEDLKGLKFGVRVDREGVLMTDFHTVHSEKDYITYRHYLQDAVFLVALSSDNNALLEMIEQAVRNPVFPLYLGRKSCPPTPPVSLGLRDEGLLDSLNNEKCLISDIKDGQLRIITEALDGEKEDAMLKDSPVSFSPEYRRYEYRTLKLRRPKIVSDVTDDACFETEHNPMTELE